MKTHMLELLVAQTTFLRQPPESPLRRTTLLRLVNSVPAPVLAHYLRLVEHDRVGVAYVRHGVCSGCHLRLPSVQITALRNADDLHVCENCGAYLMIAEEEMAEPASSRERSTRASAAARSPGRTGLLT